MFDDFTEIISYLITLLQRTKFPDHEGGVYEEVNMYLTVQHRLAPNRWLTFGHKTKAHNVWSCKEVGRRSFFKRIII